MKTILAIMLVTALGCGQFTEIPEGRTAKNPPNYRPLPGEIRHRTWMFVRKGDPKCESDWRKICWSGNSGKITVINVDAWPSLAAEYKITQVPTYVIEECRGSDCNVVFRTTQLRELDRVTRGKR